MSWIYHKPLTRGAYVYPPWSNGVGILIALVPIVALYEFCNKFFVENNHIDGPGKVY